MQAKETLSIVVPCFNEEESIPQVIPRLFSNLDVLKTNQQIGDYEIIVVDDNSTDQSPQLLRSYSNLKIIQSKQNFRGYGSALKQGFEKAQGDWIVFLDVDNTYRPEELPRFVDEAKQGSEFIMGSRGFEEKGMSLTRGMGNLVYRTIAKYCYGSHLKDVCSGYRMFHRRYLEDVLAVDEDGLDFSIQLTLKMVTQKTPIQQIPIQYDERLGESKLSVLNDGWAFMKVLLTHRLKRFNAFKHSRV